MSEAALTRTIREVRRALGSSPGRPWIGTVYGRGSRFVGPATAPPSREAELSPAGAGAAAPPPSIAVLPFSARKDRDRLRISAQLINAADDRHLWAGVFDAGYRDSEWIVCEPHLASVLGAPRAQALRARWCGPEAVGDDARAMRRAEPLGLGPPSRAGG